MRSLSRTLLAWLLPPLVIVAVVASLGAYAFMGQRLNAAYDQDLGDIARTLVPYLREKDGQVSLAFNENFYTPDYARLELDAAQLFGDTEVNVGYRTTRYFADADRNQGVTRHAVSVGLTRDFWHAGRERVQVGIDFQHEFTRNVSSLNVSLVWHFDTNRRYRDFRPDDLRFRDLRERRAAERPTNNRAWQTD